MTEKTPADAIRALCEHMPGEPPTEAITDAALETGDQIELAPWGLVVIPHEVAFICHRGKIQELALRPGPNLLGLPS